MISRAEADSITAALARAANVTPEKLADYLEGRIGRRVDDATGRIITGWRMVRGSHGFTMERDPEGTDPLPAGYQIAA
jgi:hypothetical protein